LDGAVAFGLPLNALFLCRPRDVGYAVALATFAIIRRTIEWLDATADSNSGMPLNNTAHSHAT